MVSAQFSDSKKWGSGATYLTLIPKRKSELTRLSKRVLTKEEHPRG